MAEPKKFHRKPTPEELDEGIKKSLEELDTPTPPEEPKVPEEPPVEPVVVEEPKTEEPKAPEEPKVPEETQEEIDYKKKFSESAREAQKIHAKNRKLNEGILEAGDIPEPTEEDMAKEFPDWENMDDFSKRLAKDSTLNKRRLEVIHKAAQEGQKIDKWNEEVDKYIADPKNLIDNPELEGKEEEFKLFANDPKFNSAPFSLLVPAFLHQSKGKTNIKKGAMMQTGTGGPNDKPTPKTDILTVEEGLALRKNDYNKYRELLKAGKIANE